MTIGTGEAGGEKRPLGQILIVVALLLVVVVAGYVSYTKFIPHDQKLTYPDTPDVVWMKQKALECKGDPRKLSPEDQQKLQKIAGPYYNMMMPRYYEMQGGKIDKPAGGPAQGS